MVSKSLRNRNAHLLDFTSLYKKHSKGHLARLVARCGCILSQACPWPTKKSGRLHGICMAGAAMLGMYLTLKVCPGVNPLGTFTSSTCPQGVLTCSVCAGKRLPGTVTEIVSRTGCCILPMVEPTVMAGMGLLSRVRNQQAMPQHTTQQANKERPENAAIATGLPIEIAARAPSHSPL